LKFFVTQNMKPIRIALGMTLLELMVACSILIILSVVAMPAARVTVERQKEAMLRHDLHEMRDAIDRYKGDADANLLMGHAGTENYPPDLQILVDGAQISGTSGRRVRYLRAIPADPMTGKQDWRLRSVQDEPGAAAWGGEDVFDVHSQSTATALDGTKYADW
jgi:general secretion pathway protein G